MYLPLLVAGGVGGGDGGGDQVVPDAVLQELRGALQPVPVQAGVLLKDQGGLFELFKGKERLSLVAE